MPTGVVCCANCKVCVVMKYEWRLTEVGVQMHLTPESQDDWRILEIITDGKRVSEVRKPIKESQSQEQAVIVFVSAVGVEKK